jgi:putative ABC transport system permease protein
VASFAAMFFGATMLMSFASMLDTAGGDGVDDTGKETLTTMGVIVGGWGLLLVVFAVTSTLTLAVRQRADEIALLKSVGATPAQIGRMIVGEALAVAVVAAAAAVPLGLLGGRALLALLKDTDQVPERVSHSFGPVALGMGFGITLLSAGIAAVITTRRATGVKAAEALADAEIDNRRPGRARVIGGWITLAISLWLATLTVTVMHGEGSDAMQTAGSASIFASISLALFAPQLVRRITKLVARPLLRRGPAGHLALANLRHRADRLAAAAGPIILFVGIGVGTLYMQDIDNAAIAAEGVLKNNEQRNIETLNFVVIGMIVAFACIMLINTLVASVTHRRREFAQTRLTGATPGEVLGVVRLEAVVLTVAGIALGSLASLATILPFNYARTDTVVPDIAPWLWIGVAAVAVVVTLATAIGTARRTLRVPAVEALAG